MERLKMPTIHVEAMANGYTKFDHSTMQKLKYSIQKYGQLRAINIVSRDGQSLCFEGRMILRACKELAIEYLDVINWKDFTEADQINLQVIVNELKFKPCDVELSAVLNKIPGPDANRLPFSKEVLDDYIKLLNFDWEEYSRQDTSGGQTDLFSED